MHNFTLPTGQKPHTHNMQSGATSVMPTGQHSGLSVLLMHCTSQTLQALTHPNPAHAPFPSPILNKILLPHCTCSLHPHLHPQVCDSLNFFPNTAPFTLTSCSWQIPLCNLTTTTLLSPSCISTYHSHKPPLYIILHTVTHCFSLHRSFRHHSPLQIPISQPLPYLIYKPSCLCSLSCPNYLLSIPSFPYFSLTRWLPSHACTIFTSYKPIQLLMHMAQACRT